MLKHLSELSRGRGERRGSFVEVVYEDKVNPLTLLIGLYMRLLKI